MAQTTSKKCDLCIENEAALFCYECKNALCVTCRKIHDRMAVTKHHKVAGLDKVDRLVYQCKALCETHREVLSFNCISCFCLICNSCLTSDHKDHSICSIVELSAKTRATVKENVTIMKTTCQEITDVLEKVKLVHNQKVLNPTRQEISEIQKIGTILRGVVDDIENTRKSEVEAFKEFESDQLGMAIKRLEALHKEYIASCNIFERMLEETHEITFLQMYNMHKRSFTQLEDIPTLCEPDERKAFEPESFFYDMMSRVNTVECFSESLKAVARKIVQNENTTGSGNEKGTRPLGRFSEKQNRMYISPMPAMKGGAGQTAEASGGQASGGQQQAQVHVRDVEMAEDQLYKLHHGHMHGGFPHPEGPSSDEEEDIDDSKDVILHLLWGHQDFFDQKALSKAQAEYNFYRVIQKQWKKTLKRVKIDDIKYPKFNMKMFVELPRNRPLYAVILTILEQSRDKKHGEAAAEEYYKLRVLEQHMIQQKMITAIPPGLDLDEAHYNELFQNMKTRFKVSGSQAQIRQAAEFKMVPLFEYLKLKETIINQRNQIHELASRLAGIASQQLAEGDSGFHDLGDKNRPQKLGERFAELFGETWGGAYESLKPRTHWEDDNVESDEKTTDILQKVVKVIYEFCQKVAKNQVTRLVQRMVPSLLDPMNAASKPGDKAVPAAPEAMKTKTEQVAKECMKVVAMETIKVLQKEILENELKGKLLTEPMSIEVQIYVVECIELIWCMCIQQPSMDIVWAKPGEKFNLEQFRFSGKKGKKYKLTVWPAVFLHKDGPLVASGYAVPE